ncbi:MAG: hypothetical protein WCB53_07475 [Terriglobales bacterium]
MNSSRTARTLLAAWSVALAVFLFTAMASAGSKPSGGGGSHPSGGGSHPAPQSHGPSGGGAHPGGQSQNRGPGGAQGQNRGPGGQNGMNRGGQNAGNRGNTGQNGMNRGGQNGMNRGGSQAGNRGNTGNNNRGGQNTGNRAGQNTGNRGGQNAGNNRGGQNSGNRGGQNAGNRGNTGGNRTAGNHAPKGSQSHTTRSGNHVQTRANGSVRSVSGHVNGHNVTVNRGPHGGRRVVSEHNGRRTVAYGRHGGYSQRAFYRHGGHEYYQRTYWRGGRAYAYGYRGYGWGGYNYYGYAPAYYWGPAYYGWAYNPWPAPVYYGWGWGGAPWYGYYGAYWNPYPVYPSAAFWLTDFFVGAALQAAYADQQQAADDNGELMPPTFNQASSDVVAELSTSDPLVAANLASMYPRGALLLAGGTAASGQPAMTKEIKDALSEEIKNQIAAEKTAAANKDSAGNDSGPPPALDPNIRYFVVANEEDLTDADGNECTLTGGDVVYRTGDTPDDDHMVDTQVKASRKDECAVGATVGVSTDDLMDMYNNMRQNMSDGMKEMAAKNGKNGLPKAPDTTTTGGEVPQPTPDSNVQDDLKQAQSDADAAEADAKQPN